MDKPRFIRALLEQVTVTVGSATSTAAVNPVALVRRIPEGLEIDGLREGLLHIVREHEIMWSICEGAAKVLRSEVAEAQARLRAGQRRPVKFDMPSAKERAAVVANGHAKGPELKATSQTPANGAANSDPGPEPFLLPVKKSAIKSGAAKKCTPGHCAVCLSPFIEWESHTLVGFACGHVFHLPHLLAKLYPNEREEDWVAQGLLGQVLPAAGAGFGLEDEEDEDGFGLGGHRATLMALGAGRSVGAKVTHARLLRERIRGGCPVCGEGQSTDGGR